jgi:CAAX prenyl protease-like protein
MSQTDQPTQPNTQLTDGMFSNPWTVFLLPLAVFLAVGSFEPLPPAADGEPKTPWLDLGIRYEHYPWVYAAKIVLTAAAIAAVWRGYPPVRRISPLTLVMGVVGVVVWIALAKLQRWAIPALGLEGDLGFLAAGQRSAFNPLEQLADRPVAAWGFLAVRFLGLAVVVPIIEEMFLRGFLQRYFVRSDWWNVPIGTWDKVGFACAVIFPVLMHPQEALAAAAWFAAVAWLVVRTRNVWDCVVAHAVTNLLMGVYVVASGEWWLM